MPDTPQEDFRAGFSDVDRQPDPGELFGAMDATALWPAVIHLRTWERAQLRLRPGMHVLDAGCGTGDVTRAIATVVRGAGRALGIDSSGAMVAEATRRHGDVAGIEFREGDAAAIPADDDSFDALRSERTLQWVPDAAAAMREFVRVVKGGGTIVVADTDWRTFEMDHPDDALVQRFKAAMHAFRGEGIGVGGRLVGLFHDAGLQDVRAEVAAHAWTQWDPDLEIAPSGFLPLGRLAGPLSATGQISASDVERLERDAATVARNGRLFMTVTMSAVAGRVPATG